MYTTVFDIKLLWILHVRLCLNREAPGLLRWCLLRTGWWWLHHRWSSCIGRGGHLEDCKQNFLREARDACRSLPSVNVFQNATRMKYSQDLQIQCFIFICLCNILFECDSSLNKLGGFRLVLPVPQSTWNLKGMVYQFDPVPVLGISGAYQRTTGGHCPRKSNASGHVGCVCSTETSLIRTHTISRGLYFLIFF